MSLPLKGVTSPPKTGENSAGARPAGPRWELAQRVAGSPSFQRSPRQRKLLLYICERALAGQSEDLREHQIGCQVFDRSPDYDTAADNIVRASVSQLRKRLEQYFGAEGRDEPFSIVIPAGSYVPVFEPREEGRTPALPVAGSRTRWNWLLLLVPFTVIAIAAGLWLWTENRRLRREVDPLETAGPAFQAFWSGMFDQGRRTEIIVADSSVALLQDITGRPITLDDYVRQVYRDALKAGTHDEALGAALDRLASRQYTSVADIQVALRISRLNRARFGDASIRFARDVNLRDLKANNPILLGSKRSNPWVEPFEGQLNFRLEYPAGEPSPFVRNIRPRRGEQARYQTQRDMVFGVVALVPNLDRVGHVLIIAGTGMEATEATGEFLTNPALSARFLESLGFRPGSPPVPFEALIRLQRVGGAGGKAQVLAYRAAGK